MKLKKIIIHENEITPIHLSGRDVFNLITSENAGSKSLSVGVDIIFPEGKTCPPHYHPESEEAVYLIQGKLKVYYAGQVSVMRSGDIIFIKPGTIHLFENIGEQKAKILFCFSPPVKTGAWIEAGTVTEEPKNGG
jgi:putative monooxygenase